MQVKRIYLENYRRFLRLDVDLARQLNVIVGVNGAGKSTILSALAKLLSWYARRLVSPAGTGMGLPIEEADIRTGTVQAVIGIEAELQQRSLAWSVMKNSKGAPLVAQKSDLKMLNEYIRSVREDGSLTSVPVVVAYSVNRSVVDVPLRIRKHHEFSVLSAYDDAFGNSADFRRFFEWFREYDDIENERIADTVMNGGTPYLANNELAAVRRALAAFLPEFENWKIRRTPLRMEVMKKGVHLNVEQLSDGEKCMIAMVGDLARRLVVANPNSDDPLCESGVALIDEIELHLHPAWQKTVLPRLLQTFPNVQFVVTTHSPLVVAQLNSLLYGNERGDISVMALNNGELSSLIDPETGLVMSGEMDDVVRSVDEEFDALLGGGAV